MCSILPTRWSLSFLSPSYWAQRCWYWRWISWCVTTSRVSWSCRPPMMMYSCWASLMVVCSSCSLRDPNTGAGTGQGTEVTSQMGSQSTLTYWLLSICSIFYLYWASYALILCSSPSICPTLDCWFAPNCTSTGNSSTCTHSPPPTLPPMNNGTGTSLTYSFSMQTGTSFNSTLSLQTVSTLSCSRSTGSSSTLTHCPSRRSYQIRLQFCSRLCWRVLSCRVSCEFRRVSWVLPTSWPVSYCTWLVSYWTWAVRVRLLDCREWIWRAWVSSYYYLWALTRAYYSSCSLAVLASACISSSIACTLPLSSSFSASSTALRDDRCSSCSLAYWSPFCTAAVLSQVMVMSRLPPHWRTTSYSF